VSFPDLHEFLAEAFGHPGVPDLRTLTFREGYDRRNERARERYHQMRKLAGKAPRGSRAKENKKARDRRYRERNLARVREQQRAAAKSCYDRKKYGLAEPS
jgi:hypothetical protein